MKRFALIFLLLLAGCGGSEEWTGCTRDQIDVPASEAHDSPSWFAWIATVNQDCTYCHQGGPIYAHPMEESR